MPRTVACPQSSDAIPAPTILLAGWSIRFYGEGGFAYRLEFTLTALIADLAIGIILAGGVGWFMAREKSEIPNNLSAKKVYAIIRSL